MNSRTVAIAGLAVGISCSAASAGFSTVLSGASGEPSINEIYNQVTGDTASLADLNAGNVAQGSRVIDFGGSFSDTRFIDGAEDVTVTGVFWGGNGLNDPPNSDDQAFGYNTDPAGGDPDVVAISSLKDAINNDAQQVTVNFPSQRFSLFAENKKTNTMAYSDPTANTQIGGFTGITDRQITFDVSFLAGQSITLPGGDVVTIGDLDPGKSHFLVFFDTGTDRDYNDAVLIVENLALVPLPQPAALAGVGILGLCSIRRRRSA